MWITSSLATAKTPTAIALGNFDGVHLGHQQVISKVISNPYIAGQVGSFSLAGYSDLTEYSAGFQVPVDDLQRPGNAVDTGTPASVPTVVTFFPHPQEFFSGQVKRLLTPLPEKVQHLMALGVQQLVLLPFNQRLASLSPQEFVNSLLLNRLQARQISVGEDFRFGNRRQGTVADLKTWASHRNVAVSVVPLQCLSNQRISSSRIRQALEEGDLPTAKTLLGRPYSLTGQVVRGQQLGRTLGFPTANLQLPQEKFLPRYGVYSVVVEQGSGASAQRLPGVMNIGVRPTVQGEALSVEVHVLQWSGDLYGQTLTVSLHRFLRAEQRFASLEALKNQIQIDCQAALETLMVGNLL